MGYSLDDANVQDILKSIIKCLTKGKIDKLKDRLIFCQWKHDAKEPNISDSSLMISGTVIPIKLITLSSYTKIFNVMADNKKRLPIKVLRQMKGMIYEFVKSSQTTSKVYVSDDLDALEANQNVEFVYGIGLKDRLSEVGIKGITNRDIFRDILINNDWNSSKISKLLLPTLPGKYFPRFKYLRNSGFLNDSGEIDENTEIKEFTPGFIKATNQITHLTFESPAPYKNKREEINKKYNSFDELVKDNEYLHIIMYAPLLDLNKINLESLFKFLKSNLDKLLESKYGTHYRKLVCLYDYLKFKVANK